jgi:cytoplasmic iron level regulating protein YaaA (DUF328/UPF0246 family)
MLVILSPAKKLSFTIQRTILKPTVPEFIEQAENIVTSTLSKYSSSKLRTTLNVSSNLATLNSQRYTNFLVGTSRPIKHEDEISACSITAYAGRAWTGLDQKSLSDSELNYCNKTLRIISGLYGLLKPSDIIQPYRLDMGTKVSISTAHYSLGTDMLLSIETSKNLYTYWNDSLKNSLVAEKPKLIINVASGEYWKACLEKELLKSNIPVLTVAFREGSGNSARVISVHAKLARGLFVRFMCQKQPKNVEELQDFDGDGRGYKFNSSLSNDDLMVFCRSSSGSSSSSSSSGKKKKAPAKKKVAAAKKTKVSSKKREAPVTKGTRSSKRNKR